MLVGHRRLRQGFRAAPLPAPESSPRQLRASLVIDGRRTGRRRSPERVQVDGLGHRLHAGVVGVQVVSGVVGREYRVRVGRVGERAIEVDDRVVGTAGPDPVVDRVPDLLVVRGVVAELVALDGRERGADGAYAMLMRGPDQLEVGVDELLGRDRRGLPAAEVRLSGGADVVDPFQHDHRTDLRLAEDVAIEPVQSAIAEARRVRRQLGHGRRERTRTRGSWTSGVSFSSRPQDQRRTEV